MWFYVGSNEFTVIQSVCEVLGEGGTKKTLGWMKGFPEEKGEPQRAEFLRAKTQIEMRLAKG